MFCPFEQIDVLTSLDISLSKTSSYGPQEVTQIDGQYGLTSPIKACPPTQPITTVVFLAETIAISRELNSYLGASRRIVNQPISDLQPVGLLIPRLIGCRSFNIENPSFLAMDSNKDDALKCFRIGKEALDLGDHTRALKFLSKAGRLDPSLPVEELLSKVNSTNPSPDVSRSESDPSSSLRHRVPAFAATTTSASSSVNYTEEQVSIVRQIRKKKDYYEILGLVKNCSVEDVRKSYRKLSLKVHPDKNKAPGADEAFKLVSKAFQCLSTEETRKKYDISGSDEPVYHSQAARRTPGGQGFDGFYEAEFDADEIFRNFFFGGNPATTMQFRTFNFGAGGGGFRNGNAGGNASGGFNARMLIQLLPVIVILLLNFLPSSDPVYSLSRAHPYEYKYSTVRGVNYYVKSGSRFNEEYPAGSNKREAIEGRVERDYVSVLAQNCRVEMQRRQWGFIRETPHCDMLHRFEEGIQVA